MDFFRHLLVLVFCAAVFGNVASVFGQSQLAESEVNNVMAFYEWALEADFTPQQRERFRQYIDQDIRIHGETARENMVSLAGSWAKLKQASEEVRRKARATFLREYLPQLKRSTDEDDAFLLGIYRDAHGGRDTFTDLDEARFNTADKSDLNATSGDAATVSLVGLWERNVGSGSITDGTGKTKYGNGKKFSFEFGPGGAVVYTVVEKTLSIMGCKIETTDQAKGKFTLAGETMTISLAAGTSVGTDSCGKAGNYRKVQPATELAVKFQIKQSDSVLRPDRPLLLCFDGGDGDACYEKVPR